MKLKILFSFVFSVIRINFLQSFNHPYVFFSQNLIVLNPLTVTEEEIRPSLEKRLEAIISGAALLADSSCTRDFHRERIIAECNAIRQALQDLLSEYMNNVGDWLLFLLVSSWNEFEHLLGCYKGGGDFMESDVESGFCDFFRRRHNFRSLEG